MGILKIIGVTVIVANMIMSLTEFGANKVSAFIGWSLTLTWFLIAQLCLSQSHQ